MRTFKPILQLDLANLQLLVYIALPLAYIVTGRLGVILAAPPGYATPVFLPAGIAVTATFVAGAIALPGTFLGSFLLNVWIGYLIAGGINLMQIVIALVIATGSTTQAAIGGAALRWMIGYPVPFSKPSDILIFFFLEPILCLISATISTLGLLCPDIVDM